MNEVASRLVLGWCRVYTAAAPHDARERRRAEVSSLVFESRSAGVGGRRLLLGAMAGCVDDVRWCGWERELADLPPVSMTVDGAVVIAAVLAFTAYALSLLRVQALPLVAGASAVLALAYGRAGVVRRRRHRAHLSSHSLTDLSSHSTVEAMGAAERLFQHPLRTYRILIPLLVVAFLVSGVGGQHHDAAYRVGATAWAIAWLSGFVTLLFSAAILAHRARHRGK